MSSFVLGKAKGAGQRFGMWQSFSPPLYSEHAFVHYQNVDEFNN